MDREVIGAFALCIGLILIGIVGIVATGAECEENHYKDPDNYREITVIWKKESIVSDGYASETGYFIGVKGGDAYQVQLEDYMKMDVNESYSIVNDYHSNEWCIIDKNRGENR